MVGDPLVDIGHVLASEEGAPEAAALVLRGWGVAELLLAANGHDVGTRDDDGDHHCFQTPDGVDAAVLVYAVWFLLWRSVDTVEGEEEGEGVDRVGGGGCAVRGDGAQGRTRCRFTPSSLRVQAVLRVLARWEDSGQPSLCGLALREDAL